MLYQCGRSHKSENTRGVTIQKCLKLLLSLQAKLEVAEAITKRATAAADKQDLATNVIAHSSTVRLCVVKDEKNNHICNVVDSLSLPGGE